MFFICFESSLETFPLFTDFTEISIVEAAHYWLWMFVVEHSSPVKVTSFPLSSIVRFARGVVKRAYTFDLILDPITLIEYTIRIDKYSFPVFLTALHLSLIPVAILLDDLKLTVF
jgi:hypothetical protein